MQLKLKLNTVDEAEKSNFKTTASYWITTEKKRKKTCRTFIYIVGYDNKRSICLSAAQILLPFYFVSLALNLKLNTEILGVSSSNNWYSNCSIHYLFFPSFSALRAYEFYSQKNGIYSVHVQLQQQQKCDYDEWVNEWMNGAAVVFVVWECAILGIDTIIIVWYKAEPIRAITMGEKQERKEIL